MKRWQQVAAVAGGAVGIAGAAIAALVARERTAEMPDYAVILGDGLFEVRDYPALPVVEAASPGERQNAVTRGVALLGEYLAGRHRRDDEMDRGRLGRTAPTIVDRIAGRWRSRAIIPADAIAPMPADGLALATVPARRVAVVEFVGRATDALLAERERALRDWIAGRGLVPIGPAEHALYNSPAVPPLLRRTEVWIPVRP